jgi:deoxyribose-phosphate aldolase
VTVALDRTTLARMIDHTLLRPDATPADLTAACVEASSWGVAAVCVSPSALPLAPGALTGGVVLATVIGYPSGAHQAAVKVHEAQLAVEEGAAEVDVVPDLGNVASRRWLALEHELRALRRVIGSVVLKVIVESALWDDATLAQACRVAEAAGADLVKTSTGMHPAGGATVHAVEVMHDAVGGRVGIKASGGIRTLGAALDLVDAGATRLGTSSTGTLLAEAG